jgi:death-on-curing protein
MLATLSADEVMRIHYVLCKDFAEDDDPIGYGGLRSQALLDSAVGRQHVGFGPFKKYPGPVPNAATLTYGICNDHPFHNGNKRTALVSMLAHLDKNRLTLRGEVRQDDLYDLMLALADHRFGAERIPRRARRRVAPSRFDADHQVQALSAWLAPRVSRVSRKERLVTYRELPEILKPHGYALGSRGSNSIEVIRVLSKKRGILRREEREELKVIGRIGYRNEGETVSRKTMRELRTMCKLREEDGVDSEALYGSADVVDAFVNQYRTVLRRLAKT